MNNNRMLTTIIGLVVIVGLIGWYLSANGMLPGQKKTDSGKLSEYQAVFLTNGQVYFGKASDMNSRYVTLQDIYYLQLAQSPQPADNKDQQPQISLVKLGNELHGPADEMKINRDHILFVENMKDNAKVMEAIERYQKEGPSATAPVATNAPVASPSPTK